MNGISNFVGTLIEEMQDNPTNTNPSINEKVSPKVATAIFDNEFVPARREVAGTEVNLQ